LLNRADRSLLTIQSVQVRVHGSIPAIDSSSRVATERKERGRGTAGTREKARPRPRIIFIADPDAYRGWGEGEEGIEWPGCKMDERATARSLADARHSVNQFLAAEARRAAARRARVNGATNGFPIGRVFILITSPSDFTAVRRRSFARSPATPLGKHFRARRRLRPHSRATRLAGIAGNGRVSAVPSVRPLRPSSDFHALPVVRRERSADRGARAVRRALSLSLSLSLFLAWEIFRFDSPAVPISGRIQPATCV